MRALRNALLRLNLTAASDSKILCSLEHRECVKNNGAMSCGQERSAICVMVAGGRGESVRRDEVHDEMEKITSEIYSYVQHTQTNRQTGCENSLSFREIYHERWRSRAAPFRAADLTHRDWSQSPVGSMLM